MASTVGHGLAALAIAQSIGPSTAPRRFWIAALLLASVVDLDAAGRPFGLGDLSAVGGHRALTHSLPFALAFGVSVTLLAFRGVVGRGRVALALVLATASHGVIDLLTPYGLGVTLLAPFSFQRYSLPWRPLDLATEIAVIWLPAAAWLWWRYRRRGAAAASATSG